MKLNTFLILRRKKSKMHITKLITIRSPLNTYAFPIIDPSWRYFTIKLYSPLGSASIGCSSGTTVAAERTAIKTTATSTVKNLKFILNRFWSSLTSVSTESLWLCDDLDYVTSSFIFDHLFILFFNQGSGEFLLCLREPQTLERVSQWEMNAIHVEAPFSK